MTWFNKCIVFVLLAMWLPVTQHCNLEAAGLVAAHEAHTAETNCCGEKDLCSQDGCEIVENGTYRLSDSLLKVALPDFAGCTVSLYTQLADSEANDGPVLPVVAALKPQGWVPTWHFARRAAPLSRAPSVLG